MDEGEGPGAGPGPLSAIIDAFLTNLRARSYSPATVDTYAFDLRHLVERVGDVDPATLTGYAIRRALAALHAQGLVPKTLARTLSAWRSFFNWLARQDRVDANPCLGLRPPKGDKRLPNALSVDEMARLRHSAVEALGGGQSPFRIRTGLDGVNVEMIRAGMVGVARHDEAQRGQNLLGLRLRRAIARPVVPRHRVH
jgi:hypothetical protein